jgi:ABC-type lipoprotein release transport system permease subunit
MNLILKIAWRNIMRHKGKSLVIGAILFFGALIMTAGNGIISGMDAGLEQTIVHSFTGDILLVSEKQESDNIFFDFMGKAVAPIQNYVDIKKTLMDQPFVERALPAGKNLAMVINEDGGMPGNAFLLGVDVEKYRTMFPGNIKVVEGRMLDNGEHGALVPLFARKEFQAYTNIWFMAEGAKLDTALLPKEIKPDAASLIPKTSAVLMGFNEDNSTTDIRLGVKGIIEYKALNTLWGHFVIIDIESYRRCLGYFAASDKVDISASDRKLFSMADDNLDALFTEDSVMVKNTRAKPGRNSVSPVPGGAMAPQPKVDVDAGAYNVVLVLLKKGENASHAISRLNTIFKAQKLGVRAISWKKSLGPVGSMTTIIWWALVIFVLFLFFVAIIIIVNTLSMAALERTTEIGMMRAVGARKGFISRMFLAETAMLSFVFGGLGIAAGIIVVRILAMRNFTSTNDMIQLMFGGDTFHPLLTAGYLLLTVGLLALVTLIAVVYPMLVARSITPLDAVQRE